MIIYHYCSFDTFKKIFENKTIRFSDAIKSNDTTERVALFDLRKEEFKDDLNKLIRVDSNKELSLDVFLSLIFCMSKDGDSLGQWRGYGDDGRGVNIGFNYEDIKTEIDRYAFTIDPELTEVDYGNARKYDKSIPYDESEQLLDLLTADSYKKECWREEKEVRMIFTLLKGERNKPIKYADKNNIEVIHELRIQYDVEMDRYYVDLPLSIIAESIAEITLGPQFDNKEEDVRNMLDKSGLFTNQKMSDIAIKKSEIPYKSTRRNTNDN